MFSIVTQVHRLNVTAAGYSAIIEHYASLNGDESLSFDSTVARPLLLLSKTDGNTLSASAAAAFSPPAEFILDRFIKKRWAWLVDPAPSPLLVRRERQSAAASPASVF